MYSYPTVFELTTNREDFVETIGIYDDDTSQPINLNGVLSLMNPDGFTGNNWVITDGLIMTTSTTQFTVPGFPTTNQLSSLSLNTVDLNLAIMPGDQIMIADATGQASIVGYVLSYTPSSGALVVQIGWTFDFEIRKHRDSRHHRSDYSPWYEIGGGEFGGDQPIIVANLGTGISVLGIGVIGITLFAAQLRQLRNFTYLAAMTMTDSVNTRQVFLGEVPILYGGTIGAAQPTALNENAV